MSAFPVGSRIGVAGKIGDISAEWLMVALPAIAAAFGAHSLFSHEMFARWIVDYIYAYGFGILFQYFTIAPMRGLSLGAGLVAAVNADTLSLTAWQCVRLHGRRAFLNL